MCQALGCGVTRSKRRAQEWLRKAAENGNADSCAQLATRIYTDTPYAREVGHVEEAAGVATSVGTMDGHDVPPDVLASVIHWLRKGGHDLDIAFGTLRVVALEGYDYCENEGCEVVGHLKDFKVCPQCKTARYCAPRVRSKTGLRVGTRRRVALTQVKLSAGLICSTNHNVAIKSYIRIVPGTLWEQSASHPIRSRAISTTGGAQTESEECIAHHALPLSREWGVLHS